MSILRILMEKPWTVQGHIDNPGIGGLEPLPMAKLGLRVFLTVATVIFSLIIITYADRMSSSDWRTLPEPLVLWLNTAFLIMGSIGLQWAWINADQGQEDGMKFGLLLGGGFAFAFLVGQLVAWQQLFGLGYFAAANPANAFFYLLTALHALHLLGGLVAWVRTWTKIRRGAALQRVRLSVELCAVYWHFLALVWIVMFALLIFT